MWFEHKVTRHPAEPHRAVIVSRDITDRKERQRLEVAAQAQAAIFRSFDHTFDLVVAQIEVDGGIATRTYSSASHQSILGHDAAACNGDITSLTHLYSADFLANELPRLIATFEAGELPDGFTQERSLLHADGHTVWFEQRFSLDPENRKRFLLIFRDLTDRRAREAADAVGRKYAHALGRITDVVLTVRWDDEWRVHEKSASFGRLFRTDTSLLGELVKDELAEMLAEMLVEARSASRSECELCVVRPDGVERTVRFQAVDISELEGCVSVLLVCHDLTDFKARVGLEVARTKDEHAMHFLAHELKNRLVAVRGSVESARLEVVEHAAHLLAPPYHAQEAFVDARAAIERGLFLYATLRTCTHARKHGPKHTPPPPSRQRSPPVYRHA